MCILLVVVPLLLIVILWGLHRVTARGYKLSGKHVMVTGGSSGIGKAAAILAVKKGANVTIVARNEERLLEAANELKKYLVRSNQSVATVAVDVSGEYSIVQTQLTQGDPVDVLINCAGTTHPGAFITTQSQTFIDLYKVNVLGSVQPTRVVLDHMIKQHSGCVVFVSSQAGQFSLYGYSAYGSSKYALRGLAEALQMEVKPYNIQVCISFPPDTDTPQLREELPYRSKIANEIAATSGVFSPQSVAHDIINGVEKRRYMITHGLDGYMLGNLTVGMSPSNHLIQAITQVLLMGIFRLVSLWYLHKFNNIVRRHSK